MEGEELKIVTPGAVLTSPGDILRGTPTDSIHKERLVRTSTTQNREISGLTTKPIKL